MIVEMTKDEIANVMCCAINASIPMGLGRLHYKNKKYTPEDVKFLIDKDFYSLDYFDGRMVKLYIDKVGNNKFNISDRTNPEYQSWAIKYPTVEQLVAASKL